jgi:hemerythrin-like domain-containing protein
MEKENVIAFIKADHKPLKDAIQILTSESAKPSQKKSALKKFLPELKLHSKAEEFAVYDAVVDLKEVHSKILEAYEEHSVADLLADELEGFGYENDFSDELIAKARVLAELVKRHIEEEENKTLVSLKRALSEEQLVQLGQSYRMTYDAFSSQLSEVHTQIKPETRAVF